LPATAARASFAPKRTKKQRIATRRRIGESVAMIRKLTGFFGRAGHAAGTGAELPWNPDEPPLLDRIQAAIARDPQGPAELEREPAGEDELRFAPGMLDSVMGGGGEDARAPSVRTLLRAFGAAVRRPGGATFAAFYRLAGEAEVIEVVDGFLEAASAAGLDPAGAAAVARRIAREGRDENAVKLAAALLGLFGSPEDRDLLMTLGRYEELTVYAALALGGVSPDPQEDIWQLARTTFGWGRIRSLYLLAGTERSDIREWLLLEGHRNGILAEEVAWFCAVHGDLIGALREPELEEERLDRLAELMRALARGGPAEDLRDYDDGAEASLLFLEHLRRSERLGLERLFAVDALRAFVEHGTARDGAAEWPAETRWQVRTGAGEYLGRGAWHELIAAGLSADESRAFWDAAAAGDLLGIDVWPARLERQRRSRAPGDDQWYHLMQTDSRDRIEQVLALARERIDLAKVGSGPQARFGLGLEYEDDTAVDFIVQDLGRFPGSGWDFLRTGLNGRTGRLRNMTLRALEQWGRASWPPDAEALIRAAAEREPEPDLREAMGRLLAGKPLRVEPLDW
jgi:hypothetical protein